jgi:uncharacterized membrane protein YhhN
MLLAIMTLLVVISASLFLRATYFDPVSQVYLFKPLTMVFILLIAILARRTVSSRYRALIVTGLVFSLAGDVLLMVPGDRFVLGLVSFLVAHLLYIAAFRIGIPWRVSPWSMIPFALVGVVLFAILVPGLGMMLLPVAVYMVVILAMAWQAWERWDYTRQRGAFLAFLGAVLFVVSDLVLAINRFRLSFEAAPILIWSTYVAAQWLIAFSVRRDGPE